MKINLLALLAIAATLSGSEVARADTLIYGSPANWRLQDYPGSSLSAYFTGSSCTNGLISFSSSATADDKNRFYGLILTAKTAGKSVGIFYETVSGSCQITSFYIEG